MIQYFRQVIKTKTSGNEDKQTTFFNGINSRTTCI